MSVCEINRNRIGRDLDSDSANTVYDSRMGPKNETELCQTCGFNSLLCPGHFGHIVLTEPVVHPLYYRHVLSLLRCFCIACSRLLVSADHLDLWGMTRTKCDETRFRGICAKLEKYKVCTWCQSLQPKITFCSTEACYYATFNTADEAGEAESIILGARDIRLIFERILDNDVQLLGLKADHTLPVSLIIDVLPVLPPQSRPIVITEDKVADDDLTIQYMEIVKVNNHISSMLRASSAQPEEDRDGDGGTRAARRYQKYVQTLNFRIKTLFDNSSGKARHSNARQIKGIKERLCGKDGLIRSKLMEKRCNFSARTVIGPDPTLELDQIGLPPYIADTLAYPERVNSLNQDQLQNMVDTGFVNVVIREKGDSKFRFNITRLLEKGKTFELQPGDVVERKLRDGDRLILNRQPSLHRGSMFAMRVLRRPGKTIRMNLAITGSFNADFDGDECNLHTPYSELSRAELEILSTPSENMIGHQAGKPDVGIVQDGLSGIYLLTRGELILPQSTFFQIICAAQLVDEYTAEFRTRVVEAGLNPYCGHNLFSLLLPRTFNYCSSGARVERGILVSGPITKAHLGKGHYSIIRLLHAEYPIEVVLKFVNRVQWLANEFLLWYGFSIGMADCMPNPAADSVIESSVQRCFLEADAVQTSTENEFIREVKVSMALNKARDTGMRIARENLGHENNFLTTVLSGSKGDFFNICQITGIVGQQNLAGGRIKPQLNGGTRALPHYPLAGPPRETPQQPLKEGTDYESMGFVRSSFIKGLNPKEYWLHSTSARESLCDTSTKTASSGYTHRKLSKYGEDLVVRYDGTVRNSVDSIVQFAYGGDSLDGSRHLVGKDGQVMICDVARLASKLNLEHEYARTNHSGSF